MQAAMIGLGRMGINMARRLLRGGHEVVAYNRTADKVALVAQEGATPAYTLSEMVEKLKPPRTVWIMLPAGTAVEEHILELKDLLSPGDLVIEGGNSYYKDDIRMSTLLAEREIQYLDAGISGGIWGLENGYCTMIGGNEKAFRRVEALFKTLAPENGYLFCGKTGAGHFVKMVHNGIEYGMMQAYGEGFDLLEKSPYKKDLNYADIAHLWNQGSVIRSWLLELAESAFGKEPKLSDITGYIEDSGEGRWTVQQALETGVSAPVIALSLMRRFRSRDRDNFSDKLIAALRREFGGHATTSAEMEKG